MNCLAPASTMVEEMEVTLIRRVQELGSEELAASGLEDVYCYTTSGFSRVTCSWSERIDALRLAISYG